MKNDKVSVKKVLYCYIGVDQIEQTASENDFVKGLCCFAIPNFGIQYRTRIESDIVTLEFKAFFSLLKFIDSKLENEFVHRIHIYSSLPQFVFSFARNDGLLKTGSEYRKLLEKYNRQFGITVGYLKLSENRAVHPTITYPSLPEGQKLDIELNRSEMKNLDFPPFD